jgi:hypothetical protein
MSLFRSHSTTSSDVKKSAGGGVPVEGITHQPPTPYPTKIFSIFKVFGKFYKKSRL